MILGTLLLLVLLVIGATFGRGIDAHRLTPQDWIPALGNLVVPLVLLGASGVILLHAGPPSDDAAAALLLVGLAVSAVIGNPVTGAVLALADPRSRPATPGPATPDPAAVPPASPDPTIPDPAAGTGPADPNLLRGGAWIGALERLVVTAGLLSGWGEAVLLIVAIKGLGRYPELRSSASAERFIIGTFASLLWAGAVGEVLRLGLR